MLPARIVLLQDVSDDAVDGGQLPDDGMDDLDRMAELGQVYSRRRARDADLAERARGFKERKRIERQRDAKEKQLQQARTHVNEYRPGMFLHLTSGDICTHAFTRAYRGARLDPVYHKLQNLMMSLCASGVEHAQNDGLEHELDYALAFTRAGGRVVLGAEHMYDETNQRLSVPPALMSARLHASRGAHAASESRVKNVSCPVLVSEGRVHFEYVPSEGFDVSAMQEFGSSGVHHAAVDHATTRPARQDRSVHDAGALIG